MTPGPRRPPLRAPLRVGARRALVAFAGAVTLVSIACVPLPVRRAPSGVDALRLSEVSDVGDPARRASMRLLLDGLDYDVEARPGPALGSYERALQVDPTNPYAYLTIARYRIEYGDAEGALAYLDQAESLLRSQQDVSPRVSVHLLGLRGRALDAGGDFAAGSRLLEQARELAPSVWGDGDLSAGELR